MASGGLDIDDGLGNTPVTEQTGYSVATATAATSGAHGRMVRP